MGENQSAKHKEMTEKIREQKQAPKGPIKFQIQLNEEQKIAKEKILSNAVTVLSGKAGSGKTLLACQVALDMLFKKSIQKIIITRPTVSKEEIGFLPGDLREKMEPWMQPIYSNFYSLYNKEKIDEILESGKIEIVPLAFMRGRTFLDCFIIVDEAQNCTAKEIITLITRTGEFSKVFILGDPEQSDINGKSGFLKVMNLFDDQESKDNGIHVFKFTEEDVVRSGLVAYIIKKIKKLT